MKHKKNNFKKKTDSEKREVISNNSKKKESPTGKILAVIAFFLLGISAVSVILNISSFMTLNKLKTMDNKLTELFNNSNLQSNLSDEILSSVNSICKGESKLQDSCMFLAALRSTNDVFCENISGDYRTKDGFYMKNLCKLKIISDKVKIEINSEYDSEQKNNSLKQKIIYSIPEIEKKIKLTSGNINNDADKIKLYEGINLFGHTYNKDEIKMFRGKIIFPIINKDNKEINILATMNCSNCNKSENIISSNQKRILIKSNGSYDVIIDYDIDLEKMIKYSRNEPLLMDLSIFDTKTNSLIGKVERIEIS